MIDFEHLFFGGAILGILASCWSYIKLAAWRVCNLLIVRARFMGWSGEAIEYYCWSRLSRSPYGEKEYNADNMFVQPVNRTQLVGWESAGKDFLVFWDGWKPLVLFMGYPENGSKVGPPQAITALFIRGTYSSDIGNAATWPLRNTCIGMMRWEC